MLGNKIGEERGKVIGRRMLPGEEDVRFVRMEITVRTECTILDQPGQQIGTYTVVERGPGQMYGSGQGIFMTADGQSAIWNGHGVGRMDEAGTIHFAAGIAFQTTSPKLESLNSVLVVLEHQVDMQDNCSSVLYEWKA